MWSSKISETFRRNALRVSQAGSSVHCESPEENLVPIQVFIFTAVTSNPKG
jgi:hypothetical protein